MKIFNKLLLLTFLILLSPAIWAQDIRECKVSDQFIDDVAKRLKRGDANIVKSLPSCYRLNRDLILRTSLVDPKQFQYADESLKQDEIFVNRILKVYPEVLKYAAPNLRKSKRFMENATYLQRDSLKFADQSLQDNKIFMTKMVTIDSRNYLFCSKRLKSNKNIAEIAFSDNGLLIEEAPDDIRSDLKLAKVAIKANSWAFDFIAKDLQKNKELKAMVKDRTSIESIDDLKKFLKDNYTSTKSEKGFAVIIENQAKFFEKNILAKRNYVTKWHRMRNLAYDDDIENLTLIGVETKNFPMTWSKDFANYPLLKEKIERFLKKHNIDDSTIENMKTTYFWFIKNDLPTVAFNIYGLRESGDNALGPEFADVTSLTVIAQKQGERWNMSVIEVIFSSEIRTNVAYRNGHKRYVLWDLYKVNDEDKSPKVIFKVEDKFREYFEVYEEQSGGKYNKILEFKLY